MSFDVIQILREEIGSVKESFYSTCRSFGSLPAEDPGFFGAVEELSTSLERIGGAVAVGGFPGIGSVCGALNELLAMISLDAEEQRQPAAEAIATLPESILAYVENPTELDHTLALVGLLAQLDTLQILGEDRIMAISGELAAGQMMDEFESGPARPTVATAEDVSLELRGDIAPALLEAYLSEAPSNALSFSMHLQNYLADPTDKPELTAAKRFAHTLKGSSLIAGIYGIGNVAHQVEDILDYLDASDEVPPPSLQTALIASADCMESMLDAFQGLEPPPTNAVSVLQAVLDWANRIEGGDYSEPEGSAVIAQPVQRERAAVATVAISEPTEDAALTSTGPIAVTANAEASPRIAESATKAKADAAAASDAAGQQLRVPTRTIDEALRLLGEMAQAVGRLQVQLKATREHSNTLQQQNLLVQQRMAQLEEQVTIRGAGLNQRRLEAGANFDPLEMDEYSELASITNGLVEAATDSRTLAATINQELSTVDFYNADQERLRKELQERILGTRLSPVKEVVPRLQRSIRQTAQATGKSAMLMVEGDEALLDGEVLSRLMDPLLHLLRNAVDHGIETPAERFDTGKSDVGVIKLAFRRVGPNLSVSVSDDGPGLNLRKIRSKAIEKGLMRADETLSDDELARLILLPGFTTRDQVSEVSGRGVGMDVVRERVMALKGTLNISHLPGQGTTFEMRLPASLLAIHAVLVRVRGETFAIPTASVKQALPRRVGVFAKNAEGQLTYTYKNIEYQAQQFAQLVNYQNADSLEQLADRSAVIVETDAGVFALAVDDIVAAREFLARGLGSYVKSVRGISAVSLMPDGSIVPLVDVTSLVATPNDQRFSRFVALEREAQRAAGPAVLVVDDSLSVRRTLAELLEDAGYRVTQAADGIEAVEALKKQTPKIVLTDMEMPRMNGLELAGHVRVQESLKHLPVIMITSRSTQKHRELAKAAGVTRFVTKPYSDMGLLKEVAELIANADSDTAKRLSNAIA